MAPPQEPTGRTGVNLDELRREVDDGAIDTVVLVMTDMQGRLMGKRLHAPFFVSDIAEHGAEGCHYLLAVDVDMTPVQGFEMSSWDSGYGDFVFRPDMATLRRCRGSREPRWWMADLEWHDGTPVAASPRQILRRQLASAGRARLDGQRRLRARVHPVPRQLRQARAKRYHDLAPANPYNVDYSIFGTTMVEDVIRPIRLGMADAGILVEDSKGECNFGQHEVNFRYADALKMADNHADLQERRQARSPGSTDARSRSWPSSTSARATRATSTARSGTVTGSLFPATTGTACATLFEPLHRRPAGRTRASWPTSSRPTSTRTSASPGARSRRPRWSGARDNRTCAFRVVGHGNGLRLETRLPGADCNPYLAFAAIIATGLSGIDHAAAARSPRSRQRVRRRRRPRIPGSLRDAIGLLEGSALAREAFGDDGGRPLPALRPPRAAQLRRRGHRLGAVPGLRAADRWPEGGDLNVSHHHRGTADRRRAHGRRRGQDVRRDQSGHRRATWRPSPRPAWKTSAARWRRPAAPTRRGARCRRSPADG